MKVDVNTHCVDELISLQVPPRDLVEWLVPVKHARAALFELGHGIYRTRLCTGRNERCSYSNRVPADHAQDYRQDGAVKSCDSLPSHPITVGTPGNEREQRQRGGYDRQRHLAKEKQNS